MDWVRFLDENNIPYVTRGPNTKRGEVSIKCPMCGDDDPSEHLGINLQTKAWGCHRDPSHRGKSTHFLIRAILRCSIQQAKFISTQYNKADPDTLDAMLASLQDTDPPDIEAKPVDLEPYFKTFHKIKSRGFTSRFFRYLQARGYENPHDIINTFELRCALAGTYKDRIIMPVRHNGELYGWTSRALGAPRNAPRYLMSSELVKATVFHFDTVKKGGTRLFVVEGPFDAMRINDHSYADVHATCTFGTSPTISQIALLRTLVKKFDQTFVLFDEGAEGPAINLAEWINARAAYLPKGVKDPGDLNTKRIVELLKPGFNGIFNPSLTDFVNQYFGPKATTNLFKSNALLSRIMKSKP
jgi:hypothetical protein